MNRPLPLVVVGCDFRGASTRWRSVLELGKDSRVELTEALRRQGLEGMVCLATCNRTEWIVSGWPSSWGAELLRGQVLHRWSQVPGADVGALPRPYVLEGEAAVRHVLQVALGLESFVVGERQVAGQLNRALERARMEGCSSPVLNILGSCVGRAVRRVQRRQGSTSALGGVHTVAATRVLATLGARGLLAPRLGVVGMGDIGRRVASELESRGAVVVRFNRTVHEEQPWRSLDEVETCLPSLDGLVVATAARQEVLHPRTFRATDWGGVIVDIGSPAQVSAQVGELEGVELVDLDGILDGEQTRCGEGEGEGAFEAVEDGIREFRICIGKRNLRALVEESQRGCERLVYRELPACLEKFRDELSDSRRRELEANLKELVRGYARDLLGAMERAAAGEDVNPDPGSADVVSRAGVQ